MKFTFVAAAMHTFPQSHCTDVGVYPADDVYSIAKIMKTLIEIYPIFTGDTAVFSFFTWVWLSWTCEPSLLLYTLYKPNNSCEFISWWYVHTCNSLSFLVLFEDLRGFFMIPANL